MGVMNTEAPAKRDDELRTAELAERVREQERELTELRARLAGWEAAREHAPTRDIDFDTISGAPVLPLYTPLDVAADGGYLEKLGLPGEFPFTRGPYATMYRTRLWTMRQIGRAHV